MAGASMVVALLAGLLVVRPWSGGGVRVVTLAASGCDPGWQAPSAGATTFSVHNATGTTADIALTRGAVVWAEIPTLGPDVIRPLRVTLEPGTYEWRCVSVDGQITVSAPGRVGGKYVSAPSPSFTPVPGSELAAAAVGYRAWAVVGLKLLAADTGVLVRAIDSGRRAAAEKDWLTAHLDYERLGAVYDAFGPYNAEIDGRADGLVGGVQNSGFTGFGRLEYALWHGQSQATLVSVVATLDLDVRSLAEAFPRQSLLITDVPLRAHEIIENALQFELTGDTDEGSHTNLATVRANIDGDRIVLDVLRPLLLPRDPNLLVIAEKQLTTLATLIDTYHREAGTWIPLQSLTRAQREQVDAATDAALGTLAQMPAQLELASGDTS